MGYVVYSSWASRSVTLHSQNCSIISSFRTRYIKDGRQQYQQADDVRDAIKIADKAAGAVGAAKWSECNVCIPFIPAGIT
ncbi:hypothetical protein [Brevundimonas sp.]|uniref:hypothetical protein n=1 Tax=Brevundimonas sp. TaxID=1871086 RepID=UPI0028AF20C0|nr:hypothetical protein [Brevundimonas sp.]